LTNLISIQYALIRAIPIPTPYHIKNNWHNLSLDSLIALCQYWCTTSRIINSWYKITRFKVIPSRAECNIFTYQWHSSSKIYTIRHNKTNQFWAMTQTSCNRVKRTVTQLIKNWHATRQASNNITVCIIWQVPYSSQSCPSCSAKFIHTFITYIPQFTTITFEQTVFHMRNNYCLLISELWSHFRHYVEKYCIFNCVFLIFQWPLPMYTRQ